LQERIRTCWSEPEQLALLSPVKRNIRSEQVSQFKPRGLAAFEKRALDVRRKEGKVYQPAQLRIAHSPCLSPAGAKVTYVDAAGLEPGMRTPEPGD
jgi:hypothetical protein